MYTARAGLSTLVIEKLFAGGQMTQTPNIENYPGIPQGIDGVLLGMNFQAGAQNAGVRTLNAEVTEVKLRGEEKILTTAKGDFIGRAVIIATGAGHKHLGINREWELTGKGVTYCATCDGMFYRGKTVAVVGGGNSAASEALVLSRIAKKVYLIHRRDSLKASRSYNEPLQQAENVEFIWNSQVSELLGNEKLSGVKLQNVLSGQEQELQLDGLFISIGRQPATELFRGQLELDEGGYIVADESTRTSIPGVYAVGDVRTKVVRQIVTAAADGAVAAHYAESYLVDPQ
jgi:thioredoxin reductase (NADPH)